jgi:hypothetical protein
LWSGAAVTARLLRHLLSGVAQVLGRLARGLDRAARQLEATEVRACARTPQLVPADLLLELECEEQPSEANLATLRLQPPPIPADARLPAAPTRPAPTDQERAWQELTNGRHPRLIIRPRTRPAPSQASAGPL